MKINTARLGSLLFAATLMLGACGSSDDAAEGDLSSSAESTEAESTSTQDESTTTAEETTTTVEDSSSSDESASSDDESATAAPAGESDLSADELAALEAAGMTEADLALFETLLESEAGRQGMAEGIAMETGLTTEEGLCIVENGDILGLMMIGLAGPEAEPDNALMTSFLATLDTCGIPLSAFE